MKRLHSAAGISKIEIRDAYYELGKLQLEQGILAAVSVSKRDKLSPDSDYIHYQWRWPTVVLTK